MVQACEHVFRDNRAIIMREYNSGQKQSDRIYLVLQRIVIRKNAKFWRLHLRDVGRSFFKPIFLDFLTNPFEHNNARKFLRHMLERYLLIIQ